MKLGKTQWMIDRLVETVKEGQPKFLVVSVHERQRRQLFYRVFDSLELSGESVVKVDKNSLSVGECVIDFTIIDKLARYRLGHSGFGEFWYHYADEYYH